MIIDGGGERGGEWGEEEGGEGGVRGEADQPSELQLKSLMVST